MSFLQKQQQAAAYQTQKMMMNNTNFINNSSSAANLIENDDFFNQSQNQSLSTIQMINPNPNNFTQNSTVNQLNSSLIKQSAGKSKINIKISNNTSFAPSQIARSVTPTVMAQQSGISKRVDILNATFVHQSPSQNTLQQPTTPSSLLNSTIMHNTTLNNNQILNSNSNSQLFKSKIYNKNFKKSGAVGKGPTLNIDALEEEQEESQYCLEQLISPNFQPPQSTISMQKRFSKQNVGGTSSSGLGNNQGISGSRGNNNSNSTNKFQMSGNINFYGNGQSQRAESSQGKYLSFFRKNSQRSSRVESPSCMQQDVEARSITKNKNNKQKNVKKIMNDSLNMITKSRNKYLNKSFQQQNNSSSSATRLTKTSIGGDTTLNASGNQHLSLKKIPHQRPGAETSMKKLNSTASYDILGMQRDRENDNFDQSYGRLVPFLGNANVNNKYIQKQGGGTASGSGIETNMRSPHSFAQNWSNQNTNTLNSNNNNLIHSQISGGSNSINIIQSQISQKNLGSNQKLSTERDQQIINSRNIITNNNMNFNNYQSEHYDGVGVNSRGMSGGLTCEAGGLLSSNASTTNKKTTFKFNLKSSMGVSSSGILNTPLGRSQYIQSQNTGQQLDQNQIISGQNKRVSQGNVGADERLTTVGGNILATEEQLNPNGRSLTPLSSLPKRQLNFTSKTKHQNYNNHPDMNNTATTTEPSSSSGGIGIGQNTTTIQNQLTMSQIQRNYQSQIQNQGSSNQLVRPFEYSRPSNESQAQANQKQQQQFQMKQEYQLENFDQNDFIDPTNLFYQQQAISTTSKSMFNDAAQVLKSNNNGKNQFKVPKISKLQLQQSFHDNNLNNNHLGCLTNAHKASQQQFLSMGENSDFSQEATIKQRSLTPSSGYYSVNQLNINNQSGQTEKYYQTKQRRQTNQNFKQLKLIELQQQNSQYLQQDFIEGGDNNFDEQNEELYNQNEGSLMMMRMQQFQQNSINNMDSNHKLNSSQMHLNINQPPSSGEDISFNIDCSQAFQQTNQTLDNQTNNMNGAIGLGDLEQSSIYINDSHIHQNNRQNLSHSNLISNGKQKQSINSIVQHTTIGSKYSNLQQMSTIQGSSNTRMAESLLSRKVDESVGGQSENLETSRFSSTLETQIQQNTLILTTQNNNINNNNNNSSSCNNNTTIDSSSSQSLQQSQNNNKYQQQNVVSDYQQLQQQRFLKVAPNANQIKKAVMNQVNQRKIQMTDNGIPHLNVQGQINVGQKQYFSKIKNEQKNAQVVNLNKSSDNQKDYLKQLKQEIQTRRDQQIKRKQLLMEDQQQQIFNQNSSSILNDSSINLGNGNKLNQTQVSGNNIYIINSAHKMNSSSNKRRKCQIDASDCKKINSKKVMGNLAVDGGCRKNNQHDMIDIVNGVKQNQKRDLSADNLAINKRRRNRSASSSNSSQNSQNSQSSICSCKSCMKSNTQTSKLMRSHLKYKKSETSSSFLESSQNQEECKECLDSKCHSRLCSQCNNESERCSKLSKYNHLASKQNNKNLSRQDGGDQTSGINRKSNAKKIKKDRDGRQYIKYKDDINNQVYRIDAPNNVLFNEELDLMKNDSHNHHHRNAQQQNQQSYQHRGRQLKHISNFENTNHSGSNQHSNSKHQQKQLQSHINNHNHHTHNNQQNLIPIVKRNLTPDDHLRKDQAESYILVDQKGKPRKIYIQRNVPIKVHTPGSREVESFEKSNIQNLQLQSRTIEYESSNNEMAGGDYDFSSTLHQNQNLNPNHQFSTIQNPKNKTVVKQIMNGTGKAARNNNNGGGGDSLLVWCLNTKSKYESTSKRSDNSNNSKSRCLVQ